MEELTNQEWIWIMKAKRFQMLRGYYDKKGFHSQGTDFQSNPVGTVNLTDLLHKMKFETLDDFVLWYELLSDNEVLKVKNSWDCKGHCCHSLLQELLKLGKIKAKQ
jgi:hypothetical protein